MDQDSTVKIDLAAVFLMKRVSWRKRSFGGVAGKHRSCTKHGIYTGPYCQECYEAAFGIEGSERESQSDKAEERE